jgi:hypothetical protein
VGRGACPAEVSRTPRPARSNRRASRLCSSWRIRRLIAGWERCSFFEAWVKPPPVAIATKDSSSSKVIHPDY